MKIKNYIKKRTSEYVEQEDGMGVVEIVLIIIVLISIVVIFKSGITSTVSTILKTMMNKPERLAPGHRMCAGCGATIAVRNVLRGLHEEDEAVITCATGCLEVSSFMYPYTAWKDSFIHNAFENAGATCSGVEAAYRALKKKGKVKKHS